MTLSKPIDQRSTADEVSRYRSILVTMTSDLVEQWQKRYGNKKNVSCNLNLARFLKEFSDFSWAYFDHIVDNIPIELQGNVHTLQIKRDLRRVVNNLESTWGELLSVCNQRENKKLSEVLNTADAEAKDFYSNRYKGFKATTNCDDEAAILPITYFGNRFAIRRYPFTPFPLLSFRFEALGEDVLRRNGLAHELGHFIYWNAAPVKELKTMSRAHRALDDKFEVIVKAHSTQAYENKLHFAWRNWKTEVFADIVGTLLCGPSFVDTSLQLYVEERPTDEGTLHSEDTFHPHDILRPLIGLVTLELMQEMDHPFTREDLQEIAELRKRWEQRREEIVPKNILNTPPRADTAQQQALVSMEIAQTRDIVKYILTAPLWFDAACQPRPLYELFNYPGYSFAIVEGSEQVLSLRPMNKSASFEETLALLAERAGEKPARENQTEPEPEPESEQMAKYRALINLSLLESYGWEGCAYVLDKGEGNGNYCRQANCKGDRLYVIEKGWGKGRYAMP